MPASFVPFCFHEPTLSRVPVRIAELPTGVVDKARLLDELSSRLSFPSYFGKNWDALDECLRDLSWLPPGIILLRHADLPLASDSENVQTYLSILADTTRVLSRFAERERELVVVFPASAEERVVALLEAEAPERAP